MYIYLLIAIFESRNFSFASLVAIYHTLLTSLDPQSVVSTACHDTALVVTKIGNKSDEES